MLLNMLIGMMEKRITEVESHKDTILKLEKLSVLYYSNVINILRPKCRSLRHLNRSLIRHHRSLRQLDLLLRSYDRLGYNKGNKE